MSELTIKNLNELLVSLKVESIVPNLNKQIKKSEKRNSVSHKAKYPVKTLD